jgi:hypothetical protein
MEKKTNPCKSCLQNNADNAARQSILSLMHQVMTVSAEWYDVIQIRLATIQAALDDHFVAYSCRSND